MQTKSEFITTVIKSATRPVLTIFGFVSWFYMIVKGIEYPDMYQTAVVGMLLWYFGERMLTHAGDAILNNIKITKA